jgi:hypothetical protein
MKLITLASLLIAGSAYAASAYWTGKSRYVTTVTYQQALECQYDYLGRKFWVAVDSGFCPATVQVR